MTQAINEQVDKENPVLGNIESETGRSGSQSFILGPRRFAGFLQGIVRNFRGNFHQDNSFRPFPSKKYNGIIAKLTKWWKQCPAKRVLGINLSTMLHPNCNH